MKKNSFGFIGLGLIGGSIAKTIRNKFPAATMIAYDIDLQSILQAQNEGVIDSVCTGIDDSFSECEYIFLCAPVKKNAEVLCRLAPNLSDDCILTDVGSVKTNIMNSVKASGLSSCFVGGHPMAGSEKSGYSDSNPRILENAYYILTPGEETTPDRIDRMRSLVSSLGAIPVILDAKTHDYATAVISHLPHILAASLVDFVNGHDTEDELMRTLAAGGFKDITRIASSSPAMWSDICLTNSTQICTLLEEYIAKLKEFQSKVSGREEKDLFQFFERSKEYRDSMQDASLGPIKKAYVLYCDIPDETGMIARIASLLASHEINIKNIGIIHNREFEEGTLRIEFYDQTSVLAAGRLLRTENYTIYERN